MENESSSKGTGFAGKTDFFTLHGASASFHLSEIALICTHSTLFQFPCSLNKAAKTNRESLYMHIQCVCACACV